MSFDSLFSPPCIYRPTQPRLATAPSLDALFALTTVVPTAAVQFPKDEVYPSLEQYVFSRQEKCGCDDPPKAADPGGNKAA